MGNVAIRLGCGFAAGFIAVLIFHQGMYALMLAADIPLRGSLYNMAPVALWPEFFKIIRAGGVSVPNIVHQSIWGGLFGMLFALLIDYIPARHNWLRGVIFGCIFPMLLGSWVLVPLSKGTPLFSGAFAKGGFDILALRAGFLLNGLAFGLGLGLLYPLFAGFAGARARVDGWAA